ncbi:hypothetical protein BESB_071710 [Besnoitia besnoiti]|uniref:Guanylate-binding protein n=1 Tax=Besnoitia besnoiti TaxID=94643 RepID=A0A2A9M7W1_BESBE|nr:uncharacterized protein BESB_071710 [Besnoitia besnoiti]PFH34019.1 hypothetical protein BESB_071710 [Besnoitia besnoiti]
MNHAVPVLRPAFPAPFEHSPASPHGARRGGSPPPPRRSFSFSHSRLSGASPLAVLASAAAPPMSPACFLTGDALSASLSGVEPKAQKPIRSASKSLGQKAPSSWAVGPTDTGRALSAPGGPRAAGDFLSGGCSLEGAKAKTDLRGASDDEALNLTATNPSSRKATHDRTAADMSSKSYRTVDPWASFDASGRLRGGRATGDGKAPWQEPQKTWGAKGQPAGPATSFYRGRSEGTDVPAADAPNYPYVARPSNESCSTAASYYYYGDAPKAGAASWGRLQLSDGIRYASASLGKSFSGTEVPAAPLPHAEGPAGLHASASLGADFFRSTAEPLGAVGASAVVPAVPHYPYSLADPALSMATPIFQSVHYSQPYLSSSLARGIEGNCDYAVDARQALSGLGLVEEFTELASSTLQVDAAGGPWASGNSLPSVDGVALPGIFRVAERGRRADAGPPPQTYTVVPGGVAPRIQAAASDVASRTLWRAAGLAPPDGGPRSSQPQAQGALPFPNISSVFSSGKEDIATLSCEKSSILADSCADTAPEAPPAIRSSASVFSQLSLDPRLLIPSQAATRGRRDSAGSSVYLYPTGAAVGLGSVYRRLSLPATALSVGTSWASAGGSHSQTVSGWVSQASPACLGVSGEHPQVAAPQPGEKAVRPSSHSSCAPGLAEGTLTRRQLQPRKTPVCSLPVSFSAASNGEGTLQNGGVCTPPLLPSVPLFSASHTSAGDAQPPGTSAAVGAQAPAHAERRGRGPLSQASWSEESPVAAAGCVDRTSFQGAADLGGLCAERGERLESRSRALQCGAEVSGASTPWSVAATCNSSQGSTYGRGRKKVLLSSPSSATAPGRTSVSLEARSGVARASSVEWDEATATKSRRRTAASAGRAGAAAALAARKGEENAAVKTHDLIKADGGPGRHPTAADSHRGGSGWRQSATEPSAARQSSRSACAAAGRLATGPRKDARCRGFSKERLGSQAQHIAPQESGGLQAFLDDAVAAISAFFGGQPDLETEPRAQPGARRQRGGAGSKARRSETEGVRGSPVVGTINGFAYPGGCDGAASSAGALSGAPVVTSRVTTTRRLPAVPVAPLDSSCLLSSDPRHDSRPAVKLSPVRNVTSGVAASGPQVSPVEPLEPVCPPVAQAPAEAAPASPSPSASPVPEKALSAAGSSLQSTDASSDPLATFGERAARVGKALSRREERSRNEVEESLDERSLADESQSPASAVPLSARVHLCCGVLARLMMRPAGSLCLGSPTAGGSLARLPFASAAFHSFPSLSGDRPREERSSTLGICSVLLETTAKPSNRRRLLSRPMRLIHVNRWDGREVLTVDEQARNFLNDLGTQPVAVISVCGVVQTGKSALTNLLLDETHMLSPSGFPVGTPAKLEGEKNPASISLGAGAGGRHSYDAPQAGSGHGMREEDEFDGVEEATEAGKRFGKRSVHDGCTDGVWIQAVASAAGGHEGKDDITFLVLDFEGVGCTRKTVEHDQRLFTLAMLVSHYLIYNTRGVLDADAISSLAAVSMWTQKLVHSSSCDAMRDSPGSRAGSSRLSPRAGGSPSHAHGGPSVPSGWRAPSLLWTLQDFNYTLFDEDEYPLTEDDYLEAVVATATRPVPCCFPFSSSFALGSGACASSRVCAELNLPHIRMLRQQLATLFTERACLAFPHPMGDYAPADLFVDGLASGDQTPSAANLVGGGCDFLAAGDCGGSSRATVGALLSRAGAGNSSFASSFPAVSRKAGGEAAGEASPSRQGSGRVGRRRSSSQFTFFDAPAPRGSAFFSASSPPIAGAETQRESGCGVAQFDGRQSVLETVPVADFQPIYRRRLQQAKNLVFKECRLRAAQEVPTTGASFAKVLQKIIDGINDGEVPEGSSVVVGVQKEECRQWKEKCEQNFMAELRAAFQSRLPISNRELQEGALALQKKALALFKMHIIGDDDVVRSYKQQLKDRLRKITDRAIEENERHGEWKARSRLRGVRERLNIDEKLNERLYDSMAQVNDDVERLKQEFNADLRGPSHVFERMLNDQIDELLAKGSEIVCESLLDQSRQAERAVSELQRKAEEAELTLERTHELQQKLQTRDYEAEQLRRALEEERARRLSTGSGFSEYEDEFGRYRTRRSTSRRRGRSRIGVSSQSKCLGQKKCTIM